MDGRLRDNTVRHIVFCMVALAASVLTIYAGLSPNRLGMAIFTFITVIVNVYIGRWIYSQSVKGNRLDLFRMSFLSFFFSFDKSKPSNRLRYSLRISIGNSFSISNSQYRNVFKIMEKK